MHLDSWNVPPMVYANQCFFCAAIKAMASAHILRIKAFIMKKPFSLTLLLSGDILDMHSPRTILRTEIRPVT